MERATTIPAPDTTGPLWAVRVAVVLHLAALLWEGATAGQLVTFNTDALPLHYYGAFGVHVMAGLQVVAAAWYWQGSGRVGGAPRLLLAASLLAFALGFLQAALGTYGPLQVHVPLALALTGVAVWSAVLAWRRR
ncbi:hypothetical protein [Nocardiopsis halotolerans]|uniref:hypothetical protein n=1 Tax=Nocardiopsis halotolerans TaxID=124252 RepID=UPI000347C840|nr:hypothetical protein [Nocardiopsis halotolerans]